MAVLYGRHTLMSLLYTCMKAHVRQHNMHQWTDVTPPGASVGGACAETLAGRSISGSEGSGGGATSLSWSGPGRPGRVGRGPCTGCGGLFGRGARGVCPVTDIISATGVSARAGVAKRVATAATAATKAGGHPVRMGRCMAETVESWRCGTNHLVS